MSSGVFSSRLSAYDDAHRAAVAAAGNAAEYVRRARAQRQREAVALVHDELHRRAPARQWGRAEWVLLFSAVLCAVLALIVSAVGLFA